MALSLLFQRSMTKTQKTLVLLGLMTSLISSPAISAEICDQIFSTVKPFSVSQPTYIAKLVGKVFPSTGFTPRYRQVVPYAQTNGEFIDLFASFRANNISIKTQKKLLREHPSLASLRVPDSMIEDYVQAYNKIIDNTYVTDLNSPVYKTLLSEKVINQCATGTCWINSSTSVLESTLSKEKRIDISEQYIYLRSLIDRSRNKSMFGDDITEGGTMNEYIALVKKHGYALNSDWQPSIDIYRDRTRVLKPLIELANSYHPLFKSAMERRDIEGTYSLENAFNHDAEKIVANIVGPLPSQNLLRKLPSTLKIERMNPNENIIDIHEILNRIGTSIDQGKEVFIGLNSTVADFSQSSLVEQSTGLAPQGHAMAVVGYVKDSKGQVQLLKVKNSWGTNIGDNGFIYLSGRFFGQTYKNAQALTF